MVERPNILLIMADQLSARFLPFYGNTVVQAPTLKALASESVIFDSAYCPSPLCSPSRYAMLSSQMPSRIGAYDNANEVSSDIPMLAHYLREAGYKTALSGKMHFVGPDQLHGYEERLTTDIYPADFGWTADWNAEARPPWYYGTPAFMEAGPCRRTNQIDFDEEAVYKGRQFIYDAARSDGDQPFFLTVSLTHPHDPYYIHQKYWNLYSDEEIDLPELRTSPDKTDPHWKRLSELLNIDTAVDNSEEHIRRARRAYYGAISFVDDQIKLLFEALADAGMKDNTIVVFTADHGDMLGERGLWDKMVMWENAVKVPLLLAYPKMFKPKRVSEAVSTLDLLPTLVELAIKGSAPNYGMPIDGRSLISHLLGEADPHDDVFCEYMGEGTVAPLFMIRRGRYKYIRSLSDPEQLYDLANDPAEAINLASDINLAEVLESLRSDAADRWNDERVRAAVLSSQKRRICVDSALKKGRFTSWDFTPQFDGSRQYIRSDHVNGNIDKQEHNARLLIG